MKTLETVTYDMFEAKWKEISPSSTPKQVKRLFRKFNSDGDDGIDFLEWTNQASLLDFWEICQNDTVLGRPLNEAETQEMKNMLARVNALADLAMEHNVRLMIDAEQTYFQPAIDCIVLELQRRYNKEVPTIFNTYQCYLKVRHTVSGLLIPWWDSQELIIGLCRQVED